MTKYYLVIFNIIHPIKILRNILNKIIEFDDKNL